MTSTPSKTEAEHKTVKRFRRGTHRVEPPEVTWRRIEPLFRRAGITRIADVTSLDNLGVPVYQAVRPASRSVSVSQGKGATREAARVSAAMEALELWHAEDLSLLPRRQATLEEMRGENAIRREDLLWLDHTRRFDDAPLDWLAARSLTGGKDAWLPRRMIELDFSLPRQVAPLMFHRTSNGLASGNCPEEAALHALTELVERHALFVSKEDSEASERRVVVDPESVDGHCREILDRLRDAGAKTAIFDVTPRLGVPVFFCEMTLPDLPRIWGGSGCHPSPEVALSRALTEAAQSRLTYISGARDDLPEPPAVEDVLKAHARFEAPTPERRFEAIDDLSTATVGGDLERVIEILAAAGHEPYLVDLTRRSIGLPVARGFAPGLREAIHG